MFLCLFRVCLMLHLCYVFGDVLFTENNTMKGQQKRKKKYMVHPETTYSSLQQVLFWSPPGQRQKFDASESLAAK